MPKGSILKADGYGKMLGSPLAPRGTAQAKGLEIYIQLNADKNGREGLPPIPEAQEVLIIRRTFYGLEIKP